MPIESVMPSNHLILCHPLLLLPSIFPSIRVFSSESALPIRWPQDCSFSISPSNEYSGLISFRIDWFDLPAIQGTLKSLILQHHILKASVLWHSAFLMVQLALQKGLHVQAVPLLFLFWCPNIPSRNTVINWTSMCLISARGLFFSTEIYPEECVSFDLGSRLNIKH